VTVSAAGVVSSERSKVTVPNASATAPVHGVSRGVLWLECDIEFFGLTHIEPGSGYVTAALTNFNPATPQGRYDYAYSPTVDQWVIWGPVIPSIEFMTTQYVAVFNLQGTQVASIDFVGGAAGTIDSTGITYTIRDINRNPIRPNKDERIRVQIYNLIPPP